MLVNNLKKPSNLSGDTQPRFDVALNDDQFLYLVKFKLHRPDTKELFKDSPTNSEGSIVKIRQKNSKSPERSEMLNSLPAGVRSIF